MAPRTRSPLLVAAAVVAAGGCGASVDPIVVPPGCPSQPVRGPLQYASEPGDRMISDFESGTDALVRVAGRDGSWILGWDQTSTFHTSGPSDRCPARGKLAGHFAYRDFTSWGANWTAVFHPATSTSAVPYDGSGYGGISFWAAFGQDNDAPFAVPVGISTMDTAYNSSVCSPCTDHYMTTVAFTGSWRRYEVRFSDMHQAGTGQPQVNMRTDQLVGFIIWPRQSFDLWIDDVRFEP
jgi:hypothetical protein